MTVHAEDGWDIWHQADKQAIYRRARNGKVDPGSLGVGDTRAPGVVWDALLGRRYGCFYCYYLDGLNACASRGGWRGLWPWEGLFSMAIGALDAAVQLLIGLSEDGAGRSILACAVRGLWRGL